MATGWGGGREYSRAERTGPGRPRAAVSGAASRRRGPATLKRETEVAARRMEIHVVEKEHDSLRIEIPREEMTLLIPLVEALQAEERVVEARYYLGHPYLDRPSVYLKTKGEKPQQVLKRVLMDLIELYGDALTDFDKKAEKVRA